MSGELQRKKLRIASGAGETFGVDDIAVAWADSGGFWAEEGLEVEWVPLRGGVATAKAVLAKEVDAGYGTWVPAVKMASHGEPLRVLASMALSLAQNLVVNKLKVKSVADIRGCKWGIDGLGALSHSLALLICHGLGVKAEEVQWIVSGPPPERKAHLLDGTIDCSLLRVEESVALQRDYPDLLVRLLGFDEILPLAPVQPHGVLSVHKDWAAENEELCVALVKGLIRSSRDLHESQDSFLRAVRQHVHHIAVSDEDITSIWEREHSAGSFAVNGGCGEKHWESNLEVYKVLNPGEIALPFADISLPGAVAAALASLSKQGSHDLA